MGRGSIRRPLHLAASLVALGCLVALVLMKVPDLSEAELFFAGRAMSVPTAAAATEAVAWVVAALAVATSLVVWARGWSKPNHGSHPLAPALTVLAAACVLCATAILRRRGLDSLCCANAGWQLTEVTRLAR